ncbi:MAG: M48 family metalloprotease [Woeseia sp.]
MVHKSPALFALSLLAVQPMIAFPVNADEIDPKIPPGYHPERAKDEKGIWMELRDYERQIRQSALLVKDPHLNEYVGAVVCRVAGDYCPDIRVYVIRNPGFNASMAANGMMQIWTGFLVRATTTDEVAVVIGHEIAHYTRLHTLERFRGIKSGLAAGQFIDFAAAVLAGVSVPAAQVTAILSILAYSRGQEAEADFLGTRLIADAGYDPHASHRVWKMLIAEEQAAVVKRRKPNIFTKTHPSPEKRAEDLEEWVTSRYGPEASGSAIDEEYIDFLNEHYLFLMEDQLDTNRFGRTQEMLLRHEEIGVAPALTSYFLGEMYRQRSDSGDHELAMSAYQKSIDHGDPPPEAYKSLGYLYLKSDDIVNACENFVRYLDAKPDATDRAMIEFYLKGDAQ